MIKLFYISLLFVGIFISCDDDSDGSGGNTPPTPEPPKRVLSNGGEKCVAKKVYFNTKGTWELMEQLKCCAAFWKRGEPAKTVCDTEGTALDEHYGCRASVQVIEKLSGRWYVKDDYLCCSNGSFVKDKLSSECAAVKVHGRDSVEITK